MANETNQGKKLCCISGHVNDPCIAEEEMSTPLGELSGRYCECIREGCDNLLGIDCIAPEELRPRYVKQ
jgi:NADH dehydrogenase (ubiquinone) flavoprotein 1